MARPTNPSEWAESADAEDISEPTAERPEGYQPFEDLPHSQLNWLLRELFRWADYFDGKFQGSTGLLDIFDVGNTVTHGANGLLDRVTDDPSDYEIVATHSFTGDSTLAADYIRGDVTLESDAIQASSGSEIIEVNDLLGTSGEGGFLLTTLQETTADGINVLRNDGFSGGGGFQLAYLRHGLTDVIDVEDNAGTPGAGGFSLQKLEEGEGNPIQVGAGSAGGFLLAYLEGSAQLANAVAGETNLKDGATDGGGGLYLSALRGKDDGTTGGEIDIVDEAGNSGGGQTFQGAIRTPNDRLQIVPAANTVDGGWISVEAWEASSGVAVYIDSNDASLTGTHDKDGEVLSRNNVRAHAVVQYDDGAAAWQYVHGIRFDTGTTPTDSNVGTTPDYTLLTLTLSDSVSTTGDVTVTCNGRLQSSEQTPLRVDFADQPAANEINIIIQEWTGSGWGVVTLGDLPEISVQVCYATDA